MLGTGDCVGILDAIPKTTESRHRMQKTCRVFDRCSTPVAIRRTIHMQTDYIKLMHPKRERNLFDLNLGLLLLLVLLFLLDGLLRRDLRLRGLHLLGLALLLLLVYH